MTDRLYLDNAATSFPKPACVHEAMLRYATTIGASPGRGSYDESYEAARILTQARQHVAELIGTDDPSRIIWTLNTTDALNQAIHGIVRARLVAHPKHPVHIVTTQMDHNSVLRPLNALRDQGVDWSCVTVDASTGIVDPDHIASAIRPETALVAVVHASNVTGTIQPIGAIGRLCRQRGVPLLVDAAQSLGHLPLDVRDLHIDLLAFPGHKGLLGPLGTGGLYLAPGMEDRVATTRQGGTGSVSEADIHPAMMPDRYEAGSHNTLGLAGLEASTGWLIDHTVEQARAHEAELSARVLEGIASLASVGLRLLGPTDIADRVGVFAFVHESIPPADLAKKLERSCGILVRAGIHCAPRAHEAFGTLDSGGAARASLSPMTTADQIDRFLDALRTICTDRSRAAV